MAPHPIVAAVHEWIEDNDTSLKAASAMVAARFGLGRDTPARKLALAEQTGEMNEDWLDRWTTVLGIRLDYGIDHMQPGLDAFCPRCRCIQPSRGDGTCLWCDCQTGGNTIPSGEDRLGEKRREGRSSNAGTPYLCTEEDVLEVRRLYLTGLSMRATCIEVWPRTSYTSANSMAMTMYDLFMWRGWRRREQGAVTAARNYRHGKAKDPALRQRQRRARGEVRGVLCKGIKRHAPGAGKPCKMAARKGSDYCRQHDPAFAEARAAHWDSIKDKFDAAREARYGRAA